MNKCYVYTVFHISHRLIHRISVKCRLIFEDFIKKVSKRLLFYYILSRIFYSDSPRIDLVA